MATFIRNHSKTEAGTSGTTAATALTADAAAGHTLVATLEGSSVAGVGVSGLSKPGGESAAWAKVGEILVSNSAGTARSMLEFWAIKSTVQWNSGQTITATWGGTTDGRVIAIAEVDGVSTSVVSMAGDSTNETVSQLSVTASTSEMLRAGDLVLQGGAVQFDTLVESASGGTATGTRQSLATGTVTSRYYVSTAYLITGSGGRSVTYQRNLRAKAALIVGLRADDYPPNTPVLTTNASGGTIDRSRTTRLGWSFSSPNAVDSQSAYELHYRLVGGGAWTTDTGTVSNYRDYAGGSFAAGDYEWQVRYYGALGKVSGWSTSGFFTAAAAPDGPTITTPISGATIERYETVSWSTPDGQDVYQLRRVADDAGDPDPSTIYYDSGELTDAVTRSVLMEFETNDRAEHIQLRVKVDGLWSEWDDVLVDVSYSPPPTPSRTLYADVTTATILVVIDNPDPVGDEPPAVYNDIYVDDGAGEQRRATGVPTNGSWRYMTPISGRDYDLAIRVVAVAANGSTSSGGT